MPPVSVTELFVTHLTWSSHFHVSENLSPKLLIIALSANGGQKKEILLRKPPRYSDSVNSKASQIWMDKI